MIDPSIIRASARSANIPPPGYIDPIPGDDDEDDDVFIPVEPPELYECDICPGGVKFCTCKQLLCHSRVCHAVTNIASSMTVANQCCFSLSVFNSRSAAVQHVRRMLKSKRCPVDRSVLASRTVPILLSHWSVARVILKLMTLSVFKYTQEHTCQ